MVKIELGGKDIADLFSDNPIVRGEHIGEVTLDHPVSSYGLPVLLIEGAVVDLPEDSILRRMDGTTDSEWMFAKQLIINLRRCGVFCAAFED